MLHPLLSNFIYFIIKVIIIIAITDKVNIIIVDSKLSIIDLSINFIKPSIVIKFITVITIINTIIITEES